MNKKLLLFLLLTLLSLTLLRFFQFLTPPPSTVLQTNPSQDSTEVELSLPIKFLFDKPLKTDPQITTNPFFEFTKSLDPTKTILLLIPQKILSENTDYQISLSGNNINSFVLSFKTKSLPIPTPKPQPTTKPLVLENLLSKLPVIADEYTIEYFPKQKKFLIVILKNPYKENRKKAEDWFKEQSIEDLTELNILYSSSRGVAP